MSDRARAAFASADRWLGGVTLFSIPPAQRIDEVRQNFLINLAGRGESVGSIATR